MKEGLTVQVQQEFNIGPYPYAGKGWDSQQAMRLVLAVRRIGQTVETSVFEQQQQGKPIKLAVEVSSMFGCPVGCQFCASGQLRPVHYLNSREITDQALLLLRRNKEINLPQSVCYQGIGEPTLLPDTIVDSAHQILEEFPQVKFKMATMGAKPEAIAQFANSDIPWVSLQLSLPHWDLRKLQVIFNNFKGYNPNTILTGVRNFTQVRPDVRIKFNYPCIAGLNDTPADVENIIALIASHGFVFDETTELKLSYLNPTATALSHCLKSATETRIRELLKHAKSLGAHNAYAFGPMADIMVGCGQLIHDGNLGYY